eukprot:4653746-Pyramimonas_sp.AAC.1
MSSNKFKKPQPVHSNTLVTENPDDELEESAGHGLIDEVRAGNGPLLQHVVEHFHGRFRVSTSDASMHHFQHFWKPVFYAPPQRAVD